MTTADRFYSNIGEVTESGCWLWKGTPDSSGYGRILVGKVRTKAHRYSYTLHVGPIPDSAYICHRCDVPACVNPEHLFAGTQQDNVDDCVQKGRRVPPIGERNRAAKLTEPQVREIRNAPGTTTAIGRQYGVSAVMVSLIKRRKSWTHVRDAA